MTLFERTFDNAVVDYDKTRPQYVKELYEDILKYKNIDSQSHVLEIGMGSGIATKPFLDTGCHFVGLEPGEQLADVAKIRYENYENFSVYTHTLQDYVITQDQIKVDQLLQKRYRCIIKSI